MKRTCAANRYSNHLPIPGAAEGVRVLPPLATAEQLAGVLQITPRTIHKWAADGTIPTAVRCGKVVRFHPPSVAKALGLDLPEFGTQPASQTTP